MVSLLALALTLLLAATMWLSRALAGPPGRTTLLTGEALKDWTEHEVDKISAALRLVPLQAVIGVFTGIGVILGWFLHMIFHRIRHGKNAH